MSTIDVSHVYYSYDPDRSEDYTIEDVTFTITQGEFVGLIGQTGSGKSTLIQHLNGLLKATKGDIRYGDRSIYEPKYNMRELRFEVGLVFQYPEHQLFESSILADVCYGPKNQGCSEEEAKARAIEALTMMNIGEEMYEKSPFDLSGGQKRRVAIAGVLAMRPKVLILDEPAAGLDPEGREEFLGEIRQLHERTGLTVILVSHSMEDVARYVDRLLVMNRGKLLLDGTPKDVFSQTKFMNEIGLFVPQVTFLMQELAARGMKVGDETVISVDEAVGRIAEALHDS